MSSVDLGLSRVPDLASLVTVGDAGEERSLAQFGVRLSAQRVLSSGRLVRRAARRRR
jgi:hypothetical protein